MKRYDRYRTSVSTAFQSVVSHCPNCNSELPLGALACPQCHALVYSIRLDQLARDARALEVKGSFAQARELWAYSLTLLPADSKQAVWVQERIRALESAEAGQSAQASQPSVLVPDPGASRSKQEKPPPPNWVKKLGPFGPFALLLLKLKTVFFFLFKLKFLFSFLFFIALYVRHLWLALRPGNLGLHPDPRDGPFHRHQAPRPSRRDAGISCPVSAPTSAGPALA